MSDLDKKIKEMLQERVGSNRGGQSMRPNLPRRALVRKSISALTMTLVLTLSAVVAFNVVTSPSSTRGELAVAAQPNRQGEPSESPNRATTPRSVVASGTHQGNEWSLTAYQAVGEGAAARESGFAGRESLCWSLSYGSHEGEDNHCFLGLQQPFKGDDFLYGLADTRPNDVTAFYGKIAPAVDKVTLRVEGGSEEKAQIFSSPSSLGVPFSFFVGFVPVHSDVTIEAFRGDGSMIEAQVFEALPLFTITKHGSGSGTVEGYRTEETANPDSEPLLTCGDLCEIELSDVQVTLQATADDGSVFTGWSGDCQGAGPCLIRVDRDRAVVATFEQSQ